MRVVIFLFLIAEASFACLCQPLINQNVQKIRQAVVEESQTPYKKAVDESIRIIKEEQKLVQQRIEELESESLAQREKTKQIRLMILEIDKMNIQLVKQIEMEGAK